MPYLCFLYKDILDLHHRKECFLSASFSCFHDWFWTKFLLLLVAGFRKQANLYRGYKSGNGAVFSFSGHHAIEVPSMISGFSLFGFLDLRLLNFMESSRLLIRIRDVHQFLSSTIFLATFMDTFDWKNHLPCVRYPTVCTFLCFRSFLLTDITTFSLLTTITMLRPLSVFECTDENASGYAFFLCTTPAFGFYPRQLMRRKTKT